MVVITDAEPIAKIATERQIVLLVRLHQAERAVARLPATAADLAAGNHSF